MCLHGGSPISASSPQSEDVEQSNVGGFQGDFSGLVKEISTLNVLLSHFI